VPIEKSLLSYVRRSKVKQARRGEGNVEKESCRDSSLQKGGEKNQKTGRIFV